MIIWLLAYLKKQKVIKYVSKNYTKNKNSAKALVNLEGLYKRAKASAGKLTGKSWVVTVGDYIGKYEGK